MKKIFVVYFLIFAVTLTSWGQIPETVNPVKNIIVMIPDGTSIGVLSSARYYKMYGNMGSNLYLDLYFCGFVQSFGSNSPIPDSAPTMSCYMTGIPSQYGNVAIYPVADPENDFVALDPAMAYQPLVTLMEAARTVQGKSTGIVVTCEFPHATPASCAAHHHSREEYRAIASQMAYNNLDVLIGGGTSFVSENMKSYFKNNGTTLIQDDLTAFRNFNGDAKLWALFGKTSMPNELDRDTLKTPTLEEMTRKAIERLSKNENGFFLMVEGSKIDWMAHANDAAGCITEFIAFDNAVGAAIEFARTSGETAVIIMPDHGTGGFSLGRNGCSGSTLKDFFKTVSQYKKTASGVASILTTTPSGEIKNVFAQYTGIEITDSELQTILQSRDYKLGDYTQASTSPTMSNNIVKIMNSRTCFGFSTGGHTGEDVFFAAYHPAGHRPAGLVSNVQINEYLYKAMGLTVPLPELSRKLFAKHTDVFAGLKYEITENDDFPILTVKKGKNTLTIPAFCSVVYLNGKPVELGSVTVYIDKNNTFYLPSDILNIF